MQEFSWSDEKGTEELTCRFNDFVITTAPLDWSNEASMAHALDTFVRLSGNGTRLIWGYKTPKDVTIHNDIRKRLDKHFDLKMSRQAIFQSKTHEVVILSVARRPFSFFLESFLEYGMGVKDPAMPASPKPSPIQQTPVLRLADTLDSTEKWLQEPPKETVTDRPRIALSSVSIASGK